MIMDAVNLMEVHNATIRHKAALNDLPNSEAKTKLIKSCDKILGAVAVLIKNPDPAPPPRAELH
ncbi:MAG: hypothetical protein RIB59_04455 [Rhodospirillales bacterium]